jgi:hypothetical protein
MSFRTLHRATRWACAFLILIAVAACGGSAAGAAGEGGARDVVPGDHSAALQAAFDETLAADSFTFAATLRDYGTFAFETTTTGTRRIAPVEASIHTFTAEDGTAIVHLIHDGTLWLDGGNGSLTNVGAVSQSIRDQQAPYDVAELWGTLDSQLDDYEVVGEEQVGGLSTTHYRLSDDRREQAVAVMKIPASQYSSDIWVDDDGIVRKVFRGVQADESGDPSKGTSTTWTLTEINCICPVEPPAE